MTRSTRLRGISLIEVLVVIVVLLVGILSVVRLFPPGFLINKQSEARTLSARLAKQEQDRYTTASASLPDAVIPAVVVADPNSPTGYYIRADLDTLPDDLAPPRNTAPGIDTHYLSGLNRIRWIKGETVRIPNSSPLGAGVRGSVYLLSSGPIYDHPGLDFDNNVIDSIVVSGAPLLRRVQDAQDQYGPYLRGPAEYAIDYDDGMIAFYGAPYNRVFKISYSYYGLNNDVQSVVAQQITVPASDYSVWQPIYAPGGRVIVPDSDVVAREFRRLAYPPAFTDDPYEYAVTPRSANVAAFASIGALVFNPLGRDYVERSAYGNVPLTAKIDYNVLDWHIVREDRAMPASSPFEVRTTLQGIKKVGDYENDQSKYAGLWRDPTAPQVDVLVYNVSTGQEVAPADYRVNHREGVVTFTDTFGSANASGTFRLFYRARGDWGVQLQKAAAVYRRAPRYTANLGLGEFYLGGGTDKGRGTRLYLPLMEAGKTIVIRDIWYYALDSSTGNQTLRHATNETYRVNASPTDFEFLGRGMLTWIDILDNHHSPSDTAVRWAFDVPAQPAQGVAGISLKVRVLWNNGGSVTQTTAGNIATTRWRRQDLDTFLTRGSK